jgi:hypothetical protein
MTPDIAADLPTRPTCLKACVGSVGKGPCREVGRLSEEMSEEWRGGGSQPQTSIEREQHALSRTDCIARTRLTG